MRHERFPQSVDILGVPVSTLGMQRTIDRIGQWIRRREARYVCAIDVYNIVRSRSDEAHRVSLDEADMVTPDGTPLVWVGRLKGHVGMCRVCGPDLLPAVCERSVREGWRHYFYGGADGVAETLAARLQERFPGLRVAGCETPPFRPLTEAERDAMVERIRASKADIVWVGLGCPKQEAWMRDNVDRLGGPVLIGIGAAFDFHTDRIHRAPRWMRDHGLEWFYRLVSEPRRLWRRYLVFAPKFVALCLRDAMSRR